MSAGVGVLRPEHGPDLKYTVKVSRDGHLLVQLGGLGQTSRTTEIIRLEHTGTTLALT